MFWIGFAVGGIMGCLHMFVIANAIIGRLKIKQQAQVDRLVGELFSVQNWRY